jgi:hypothetical protein
MVATQSLVLMLLTVVLEAEQAAVLIMALAQFHLPFLILFMVHLLQVLETLQVLMKVIKELALLVVHQAVLEVTMDLEAVLLEDTTDLVSLPQERVRVFIPSVLLTDQTEFLLEQAKFLILVTPPLTLPYQGGLMLHQSL